MSANESIGMDPLAKKALERLLRAADKHAAGAAARAPALPPSMLADYHALRSLKKKEAFEATMAYGQAEGAVKIQRPRHDPQGLIERVDLVDALKLAALLGKIPHSLKVERAKQALDGYLPAHPVLIDVLSGWKALSKIRNTGPGDVAGWIMACDVVRYCRDQVALGATETPVRDASARLFKDSKRIESLVPRIDVLLTESVDDAARPEAEVLQELGLYREPQPVRLAGHIVVLRERGALPLDRPYCALPPSTVLGLVSVPRQVLTIENQTTFHVWARQHFDSDVLCIYTAGMPSPAWRAMYLRLLSMLPVSTAVLHWGDVDEGGFRIAAFLSQCAAEVGHTVLPWKMRPADVPESLRRVAPKRTLDRMVDYAAQAGWNDVAKELVEAGLVAEQEG